MRLRLDANEPANCDATSARAALSPEDQKYRDLLEQLETQAAADFDKTATALSGGALAISLAFLKDIAPQPIPWTVVAMLAPAWLALIVSLLAVLLSQMASQRSMRHAIQCLDNGVKNGGQPAGGKWRTWTSAFNDLAWVGCVLGITVLLMFVVVNTWSKSAVAKQQTSQSKPAAPSGNGQQQKVVQPSDTRGRVTPDPPPPPPKK